MEWTLDKRGEEAIRLRREEGLSAEAIRRRINAMPGPGRGTISRNAINGFLWRRKIKTPLIIKSIRQKKVRVEAPRPKARKHVVADLLKAQPTGVRDNNTADELQAPSPERQPIITRERGRIVANDGLTIHSCRWPIGDPRSPDFHFCGRKKVSAANGLPILPYCEEHARRAFEDPDVRRSTPAVVKTLEPV